LGLTLVASACGAGPYDLLFTQNDILARTEYDDPFYLAYVYLSYKSVGAIDNEITDFFKEPYASLIPDLFDGINDGSAINARLTNQLGDLLTEDFRNGTIGFPTMEQALIDNSVPPKATDALVRIYHSPDDQAIPFGTSQNMYDSLIGLGLPASQVELVTLSGGHGDAAFPMVLSTLQWFQELKD
jgi:hypothetical protein